MQLAIDENDRIVDIRGDKGNPITRVYAYFKGLQAEDAHHGPTRLCTRSSVTRKETSSGSLRNKRWMSSPHGSIP